MSTIERNNSVHEEWSWHVNSIVACCHSAKLCAYDAWDFLSQHHDHSGEGCEFYFVLWIEPLSILPITLTSKELVWGIALFLHCLLAQSRWYATVCKLKKETATLYTSK